MLRGVEDGKRREEGEMSEFGDWMWVDDGRGGRAGVTPRALARGHR